MDNLNNNTIINIDSNTLEVNPSQTSPVTFTNLDNMVDPEEIQIQPVPIEMSTPKNTDHGLRMITETTRKHKKTVRSVRERSKDEKNNIAKKIKQDNNLNGSINLIDPSNNAGSSDQGIVDLEETVMQQPEFDESEDYLFLENAQPLVDKQTMINITNDIQRTRLRSNLNMKLLVFCEENIRELNFNNSPCSDVLATGFIIPNLESQETVTIYSVQHRDYTFNFRMMVKMGKVSKIVLTLKETPDNKFEIDYTGFENFNTLVQKFQKNYSNTYMTQEGIKISYTPNNQMLLQKMVRDKTVSISIPKFDMGNFFDSLKKATDFCNLLAYIRNEQITTLMAFGDKLLSDDRFCQDNLSIDIIKVRLIQYYHTLTSGSNKYKLPYRFIIQDFLNKL